MSDEKQMSLEEVLTKAKDLMESYKRQGAPTVENIAKLQRSVNIPTVIPHPKKPNEWLVKYNKMGLDLQLGMPSGPMEVNDVNDFLKKMEDLVEGHIGDFTKEYEQAKSGLESNSSETPRMEPSKFGLKEFEGKKWVEWQNGGGDSLRESSAPKNAAFLDNGGHYDQWKNPFRVRDGSKYYLFWLYPKKAEAGKERYIQRIVRS